MSNIEERSGILMKIETSGNFLERVNQVQKHVDFPYTDIGENWVVWESPDGKREIIYVNGDFYYVFYYVNKDDSGNLRMFIEGKNMWTFAVSFYNGGTCFEEVVARNVNLD